MCLFDNSLKSLFLIALANLFGGTYLTLTPHRGKVDYATKAYASDNLARDTLYAVQRIVVL
jgi:hypothetical protein